MPFGIYSNATPQDGDIYQTLLDAQARQAQQAQFEAQTANQAYQQALAAPPPQINPAVAGIGSGLARLATTLAGPHGPDYAGLQRQTVEQQGTRLATERKANLDRLLQTYQKAAERAQRLGDTDAEIKSRLAIQKLHDRQEQEMQDKRQAAEEKRLATEEAGRNARAAAEEAGRNARSAAELASKQTTTASGIEDVVTNNTRTTDIGTGSDISYIDATNLKGKDLTAAQQVAAKSKTPLLVGKQVDGIHEAENARDAIKGMVNLVQSKLPSGAIDLRRITNPLSAFFKTDDDLAAYGSFREASIQVIPALVTRGIRITNAEINMLQRNIPALDDPVKLALKKRDIYTNTLNRIIARQLGREKEVPPFGQKVSGQGGGSIVLYKNGHQRNFTPQEAEDAQKNYGWTTSP